MSTDQANIDTWVLFIGPFDTRCMQSRLQIMMSDGNIFNTSEEEQEQLRRLEAAKARARQLQKMSQTASAGALLGAAGLT